MSVFHTFFALSCCVHVNSASESKVGVGFSFKGEHCLPLWHTWRSGLFSQQTCPVFHVQTRWRSPWGGRSARRVMQSVIHNVKHKDGSVFVVHKQQHCLILGSVFISISGAWGGSGSQAVADNIGRLFYFPQMQPKVSARCSWGHHDWIPSHRAALCGWAELRRWAEPSQQQLGTIAS